MDTLPAKLIHMVAAFADRKAQCRVAQVCREWAAALSSPAQSDQRKIEYAGINHKTIIGRYLTPVCHLSEIRLPNGEIFVSAPFRGRGYAHYRNIYLADRVIREQWDCWYYTCIDSINEYQGEEVFMHVAAPADADATAAAAKKRSACAYLERLPAPPLRTSAPQITLEIGQT
jgi:hypothetical protein